MFLQPDFVPRVRWLPAPRRDQFRADPFAVEVDGRLHIFYELFDYRDMVGRLHRMVLEDGLPVGSTTEFVRTSVHASYPYIFQYMNSFYCVPETKRAEQVTLYCADASLAHWRRCRTIISGFSCTDPTVFEHDSRWYLICGGPGLDRDHELSIWHAATPLSDWQPHEKNPVKIGDRRSRPGGSVFRHSNALYRPAQDGAAGYGSNVVIYKIMHLSPSRFEEEEVATVNPDPGGPYPYGLHTLSSAGHYTLIDGKRLALSPSVIKRRFGSLAQTASSRLRSLSWLKEIRSN
jgi:hypothetical protein